MAYSDRIVRPHWKKIHMELKATDCVFFFWAILPRFNFFYE